MYDDLYIHIKTTKQNYNNDTLKRYYIPMKERAQGMVDEVVEQSVMDKIVK